MAQSERQYECIVFGATGYTGKYTAEHITTNLPTDFRWAVAGRSEAKLRTLVDELKAINPDRTQPGVLVSQLEKQDLVQLAKKTKVLITTVGPYHKYGTIVVEACAETGTHYLDVTGEVPWTYDMVNRYQETAKKSGAIMIPQDGMESAPTDLICWLIVRHIRETFGVGTKEVVSVIWDLNATPSGGTLATLLGIFETFTPAQFSTAQNPWSLCPVSPPRHITGRPIAETITGVRSVSGLGTLTDSLQGPADIPIVGRSWGLYDGGRDYGENFHVSAYTKSRNVLTAFAFHLGLVVFFTSMMLSPARWLLKQFIYEPGQGPTKEQGKTEYSEWRAIGYADTSASNGPKQAHARMRWNGSMYHFTGVCLAESALILARERVFAHELGGGFLTPATLGAAYIRQLENAGLEVEVSTMA